MKRNIIIIAVSLLIVIPCFLGFASGKTEQPATSKEVELTYWGWGPHVDAVNNEIGPAFTKEHPNVRVKAISMGPWDLMDKFYVSIVTGKGAP
ncbi:MAG TPA: hypothetical protein VM123_14620, partial [archaeon]|nr:hypothetical protein [archaeon]